MTLLTNKQAADLLGVHINTLDRWRRFGAGPPVTKVGRYLRYREDLLEAWVDSKTDPLRKPLHHSLLRL